MICRKCKTAIAETEKTCASCGSSTSSKPLAIMLCAVLLGGLAFCYAALDSSFLGQQSVQADPIISQPETTVKIPKNELSNKVESMSVLKPEAKIPKYEPNFGKKLDEVWEMVRNVANASKVYYDEYSKTKIFVTQNGYFYDVLAQSYVQTSDLSNLAEITHIDKKYENESVLLLFLKPSDLANFEQLELETTESDKLQLFAAYETREGYALATAEKDVGILTREKLYYVLEKYNNNNGEIIRLDKESWHTKEIENAISIYLRNEELLDVRYLAKNNKYAFAVVSQKGAPQQIKQFVVLDEDGKWTVALSDFETLKEYKEIITENFVDFPITMLPPYNMFYDAKLIKSDFSEVIATMIEDGIIGEEGSAPSFITGTDKFAYIEFPEDKKFIGYFMQDIKLWNIVPVSNYVEAEKILVDKTKEPPLFIIKQY